MVRQEPGAVEREQFRSVAAGASARGRRLHGRRRANGIRPFRRALRRADRGRRDAAASMRWWPISARRKSTAPFSTRFVASLGCSFYDGMRDNLAGIDPALLGGTCPISPSFDMPRFLAQLTPADTIAARHTVGLVDVIGGHPGQVERWLAGIAGGSRRGLRPPLFQAQGRRQPRRRPGATDRDCRRARPHRRALFRLARRQRTVRRYRRAARIVAAHAGSAAAASGWSRASCSSSSRSPAPTRSTATCRRCRSVKPVIIDESDDELGAFPRARGLGYAGVSSKCCKGLYKSILNAARCAHWNAEAGSTRYFMTGEDLTTQAGLAVQQDLALVNLIGLRHVERNGHHYVNGMAGLPGAEQAVLSRRASRSLRAQPRRGAAENSRTGRSASDRLPAARSLPPAPIRIGRALKPARLAAPLGRVMTLSAGPRRDRGRAPARESCRRRCRA